MEMVSFAVISSRAELSILCKATMAARMGDKYKQMSIFTKVSATPTFTTRADARIPPEHVLYVKVAFTRGFED
jgi:hypothetical protein